MRKQNCVFEALKSWTGFSLVILPILLLLLSIAGTYAFSNSSSKDSRLLCQVDPKVTWLNQPITYSVTYQPASTTPNYILPKTDIMYVVDVSSSMGNDSIAAIKEAIKSSFYRVNLSNSENIRVSLIQFQSEANILMDWSSDTNKALDNLNTLKSSGNTDIDTVFKPINQLFNQSDVQSKKILIFYTDGDFDSSTVKEEVAKLTEKDIEIYVVTPYVNNGMLKTLAHDKSRVYFLNDANSNVNIELSNTISHVIYRSLPSTGYNVRLQYVADRENFSYNNLNNSIWYLSKDNQLVAKSERLLDYQHSYRHTLTPKNVGFWSVGFSPVGLSFVDKNNTKQSLACESEPSVLILDWWLFLLLLPSVIWLVNSCLKNKEKPERVVENTIPNLLTPIYPNSTLTFPNKELQYFNTIPTLFIFVGRKPQEAFKYVYETLVADYRTEMNKNLHSLLIGVEKDDKWLISDHNTSLFLPNKVKHVASYSDDYLEGRAVLPWLDAEFLRDQSSDERNDFGRSEVSRKKARLMLSRWLDENNDLKSSLRKSINVLMDKKRGKKTQVIFVIDQDDPTGSTWLLDISILSRRLIQDLVGDDLLTIPPDVMAILWTEDSAHHTSSDTLSSNRYAFFKELETLQKLGAYPHRNYLSEKLNHVDNQAPFDKIIHIDSGKRDQYFVLKKLLSDISQPLVNQHLLKYKKQELTIRASGFWEPLDQWREAIKVQALLTILGSDVLFDVTHTESRSYFPESNEKECYATFDDILERYQQSLKTNDGNYLEQLFVLIIKFSQDKPNAVHKVFSNYRNFVRNENMPDVKWWQQSIIEIMNYHLYVMESAPDDHKYGLRHLTFTEYKSLIIALKTQSEKIINKCGDDSHDQEIKIIFDGVYALLNTLHDNARHYEELILKVIKNYRKNKESCIEKIRLNNNSLLNLDTESHRKIDEHIVEYTNNMFDDWLSGDFLYKLKKHIYLKIDNDFQDDYKESLKIIIRAAKSNEEELSFSITNFDKSLKVLEEYFERLIDKHIKLDITKVASTSIAEKDSQKNLGGLEDLFIKNSSKSEECLSISPLPYEKLKSFLYKRPDLENYLHNEKGASSINNYYIDQANSFKKIKSQSTAFSDIPFVKETEFNTQWIVRKIHSSYEISQDIREKFTPELRTLLSNREKLIGFAELYDTGRIYRKYDRQYTKQWFLDEQQITYGESSTLLDAGIYIISYIDIEQYRGAMKHATGQHHQELYSELSKWVNNNYDYRQQENTLSILVQLIIVTCLDKEMDEIRYLQRGG